MHIKASTDTLSGLLFVAIGAAALAIGSRHQIGTAARMGPGYFPVLVSGILILLGTSQLIVGIVGKSPSYGKLHWRPLAIVTLAMVAFALLIESSLLLACVAVVVIARLAQRPYRPIEVAILALSLAIASAGLFVYSHGLPLRLNPF